MSVLKEKFVRHLHLFYHISLDRDDCSSPFSVATLLWEAYAVATKIRVGRNEEKVTSILIYLQDTCVKAGRVRGLAQVSA